jgi:hypothetical protein
MISEVQQIKAPEGMTYHLIAFKVIISDTEIDFGRLYIAFNDGWKPVHPDRHPELAKYKSGECIVHDGLILCEKSTDLVEQRKVELMKKTQEKIKQSEDNLSAAWHRLGV